ncbi:hypothetical protein ACHAPZ_008079 [Fusarium culmorum]|uniref:Condensation domain-containing protein n=1 Tax=Fusarium culmorum TaxID=5516 RepID=A0A2T4GYV6_FUSCU|nr:hypothetical protein FCULG_00010958 [Fusarium culmorum]
MQRAIPHDTTVIVDCSDITDSLASAFVASIPAICRTYRVGSGLVSTALETAKFAGVCNAAMVLEDGFFIDMDATSSTIPWQPSIFHDTNLDFFICLGSVASVIDNVASIIHIAYVTDVGYVTREQRGRQLDSHFRKVRLMPTSKTDVHHAFMEALSTTAYPHEALRTCFFTRAGDGQPWQGVLASPRVELNHVSVEENATVGADVKRLSSQSWDMERGDTFELGLMSRDSENHELFIAYHHILMDLFGPGIIMRDLNTSYQMKLLDRSVDSVAIHDETQVANAIEVGFGPVVKYGQENVLQRSSLVENRGWKHACMDGELVTRQFKNEFARLGDEGLQLTKF